PSVLPSTPHPPPCSPLFPYTTLFRSQLQFKAHFLRSFGEFVLALPASRHFAEFCAVGRDQRRTAIAAVIVPLRVDQDRLSRGMCQFDHLLDVPEPALAVVRQEIGRAHV